MSADIDTIFHPEIRHRPGWQKALPWIVAVVLVGGAIAGGIIWANTGKGTGTPFTNQPGRDVSKGPPPAKLTPGGTRLARKFLATALAPKHPRRAHQPGRA